MSLTAITIALRWRDRTTGIEVQLMGRVAGPDYVGIYHVEFDMPDGSVWNQPVYEEHVQNMDQPDLDLNQCALVLAAISYRGQHAGTWPPA